MALRGPHPDPIYRVEMSIDGVPNPPQARQVEDPSAIAHAAANLHVGIRRASSFGFALSRAEKSRNSPKDIYEDLAKVGSSYSGVALDEPPPPVGTAAPAPQAYNSYNGGNGDMWSAYQPAQGQNQQAKTQTPQPQPQPLAANTVATVRANLPGLDDGIAIAPRGAPQSMAVETTPPEPVVEEVKAEPDYIRPFTLDDIDFS
jgi:hypothetical protein